MKRFLQIAWIVFLISLIIVTGRFALSDNISVTQGIGTTIATDVVTRNAISENQQIVKMALGADGTHDGFARMGQQTMANSLAVVLPSDQSIGGGTEYTEDAAAPADPVGKALILKRRDALSGSEVSGNGDNIAAGATSKGELYVKQTDAVPVTDNSGSLTVDNAGTFAVQVDGSALTSLQLIDDAITTTGSAVTAKGFLATGTDGTNARGIKTDTGGELQIDILSIAAGNNNIGDVDIASIAAGNNNIGDVDVASIAAGNNNIGDVDIATMPAITGNVGILPLTTGGNSIYRNLDLDETGVSVKASAGQLYGYFICNRSLAERFVKLYNKASAATVGTDTPVITIPLSAGAADKPFCANVGWDTGVAFATGIAAGATTGLADANTGAPAANDVVVNLFYK